MSINNGKWGNDNQKMSKMIYFVKRVNQLYFCYPQKITK
jgi:hypothetical protein